MAKVVAEYDEGPHEGPVVGVQLGRSHINLSQQSTLELRKGKTKFEPLKDGGVHKEEGFLGACAVINAHRLTLLARQNLHVQVMFPPEDVELLVKLIFLVLIDVLKSVYLRSFGQKAIGSLAIESFVINGRWRVWCSFGSGHLKRGS